MGLSKTTTEFQKFKKCALFRARMCNACATMGPVSLSFALNSRKSNKEFGDDVMAPDGNIK